MKQYCRYCAFCFDGDGYGCSNEKSKRHMTYMSDAQIRRVNRCPYFELADDVITGREYCPRKEKQGTEIEIARLF